MQGGVISFQIDHTKLLPGVYLHEIKPFGDAKVTTYDLRFKRPNKGDYLTPCASHTIEHVVATFFTEHCPDKIYFGPMGCLTGFYLVLFGEHTLDDLLSYLPALDNFWKELLAKGEVPAQSPTRCGQYTLLDIREGYAAWEAFYSARDKWATEYPWLE